MKEKLKKFLQFIANPRFLLCFGIAWMFTNGWSYIMFAAGVFFDIYWMKAVAGGYLAYLWLPISPEKLVTCAIAIVLLRWLFPGDQKTLAVLRDIRQKAANAFRARKEKKKAKKAAKEQEAKSEQEPSSEETQDTKDTQDAKDTQQPA